MFTGLKAPPYTYRYLDHRFGLVWLCYGLVAHMLELSLNHADVWIHRCPHWGNSDQQTRAVKLCQSYKRMTTVVGSFVFLWIVFTTKFIYSLIGDIIRHDMFCGHCWRLLGAVQMPTGQKVKRCARFASRSEILSRSSWLACITLFEYIICCSIISVLSSTTLL